MKSDNTKQRVVSVSAPANKVDLIDLWNLLVQRKTVVISVAITIFLIIVLNFHFNSPTPIYKAIATVTPPTQSDIDYIDSQRLFNIFLKKLMSRALRIHYFNNNLIEQFEINGDFDKEYLFEERFNKKISVRNGGDHVVISFEGTDARLAVKWVNGFIAMANEDAVRIIVQNNLLDFNKMIDIHKKEIEELKKKIEIKSSIAKINREVRIHQLEETALMADIIGINDFTDRYVPSNYMMDSIALRKQANILRHRESDDPFNEEIMTLKFLLKVLISNLEEKETTKPIFSDFTAIHFKYKATASARPINTPDIKSVILTAVLSGLALGILAAFFTDFIARARKRRESSSH
jgi:LPS O-antigen subunit length determinant protein (WzzB/FepE family)